MLRIQKVFLQGFKSFCDPVEVLFDEEGITAVVGPNGCGKSNLSEAISWVIGEQRPRALRGGKMEDVIFQGSRNRSASGMAEVLLTLIVREAFEVRAEAPESSAPEPTPSPELTPTSVDAEEQVPAEVVKAPRRRRPTPAQTIRLFQEGEQVTVGRRLYRTGESEYEMNGRTCRLRDIQDLFAGTGLGGAHYAIIEQGRIGQVLSAKPLDRRALIEEAAGVSKFKLRQHAAELKLEASRQNLSRLIDIITEIERQQNSLKRQASRARRYQRLRNEMRELMRAVFVADYRTTRTKLTELAEKWDAVSSRESEAQNSIADLEQQQAASSQSARVSEEELTQIRHEAARVHLEVERTHQQHSHLTEQLQAAKVRSTQFAKDRQAIFTRSRLIEQEANRLASGLRILEDEILNATKWLTAREEEHRVSLVSDAEAERLLEETRDALYAATTHLERWRHLHHQFSEAVDRSSQRLDGLTLERERTESQAETNVEQRHQLSTHRADIEKRQADADSQLMHLETELDSRRAERAERAQTLSATERELNAAQHRLGSLAELDARHAYFSEAVQLLLNTGSPSGRENADSLSEPKPAFRTLGTLADHVDVRAEDEAMIEAVLHDELQYVLVPTFDDAFAAIDFLKGEGGGRATFVVVGLHGGEHPVSIVSSDPPDGDPPSRRETRYGEGHTESSHDAVDEHRDTPGASAPFDSGGEPALLSLLGLSPEIAATFSRALPTLASAPVVESSVIAIERIVTANGSAPATIFVTRNGERIAGGQLLSGGSAVDKRAGVLALRREIHELGSRVEALSAIVEASQDHLRISDAHIGTLEAQREELESSLRSIDKEMAVLTEQLQQCVRESERIDSHLRVVAQESSQVELEMGEFRDKLEHAGREAAEAETARLNIESTVASTQARVAELRRFADERSEEIARQRAEYAAFIERRRGLQNDRSRLDSESRDLEDRLSRSSHETIEVEAEIKSFEANLASTAGAVLRLTEERQGIDERVIEASANLGSIRQRLEELASDVRQTRQAAAEAREERAQLELERVRLTASLDHIAESCHHELGERIVEIIEKLERDAELVEAPAELSPAAREPSLGDENEDVDDAFDISFWRVPADFDLDAAKFRLNELRSKIDSLGPINMMALEELTSVEERFNFLSGQRADIEKAVADTQAAILEIRRRSRERFVEAFAAINANFALMFQELFGGGRGEMRLIDESDILESGIEIIAQPPGKRLQNVLLLSGGEKAMAAIALVLAIFKYRPSPFCILDEVDAPLDEVNIGRFADKVTEMSQQTQFVIITHSKRTMEAAQALYGVTMEDPGVSKLVAVRLT